MRTLTYAQTFNETLRQLLRGDETVFLIGQGVKSPWYVGSTTLGLVQEFGESRIIDTPVAENAMTGVGIGAALSGLRPIIEHPRMDFMYLAMDQLANHAANWYYMFGSRVPVPITVWGIINRGGEQAAQHSQALQAMFAHLPGIKVVMPSTPYDLKGLLVAAVRDDNPVLLVDDRWLYEVQGEVPEELYEIPLGQGIIRRPGSQATVAATSFMVHEALKAAAALEKQGVDLEVLDLRSVKPLDQELLFASVIKTGRLVVADAAWKTCGVAAEIAALAAEHLFADLKGPVLRVTLPDLPAPASAALEKLYYPTHQDIEAAVLKLLGMNGQEVEKAASGF
jgi:pyruvate/2-oxoglutarate/acetoin dehydrogenase E1 component